MTNGKIQQLYNQTQIAQLLEIEIIENNPILKNYDSWLLTNEVEDRK